MVLMVFRRNWQGRGYKSLGEFRCFSIEVAESIRSFEIRIKYNSCFEHFNNHRYGANPALMRWYVVPAEARR